jgi:hypothetical protein
VGFAEPYDNLVPPDILYVKGDSMSEENKAIVRRLAEEMVSSGNMAAFDELVSRDAKAHHVPPGMTPDFEGWKGLVGMVLGAFPDGQMNIEELIAADDKVVAIPSRLPTGGILWEYRPPARRSRCKQWLSTASPAINWRIPGANSTSWEC